MSYKISTIEVFDVVQESSPMLLTSLFRNKKEN